MVAAAAAVDAAAAAVGAAMECRSSSSSTTSGLNNIGCHIFVMVWIFDVCVSVRSCCWLLGRGVHAAAWMHMRTLRR